MTVFGLLVAYDVTAELWCRLRGSRERQELEVKLQSALRPLFLDEECHHCKSTEQKTVPVK